MSEIVSVCLLGFGEVGQTLLPALQKKGVRLRAFDQQFGDSNSSPSRAAAKLLELRTAGSAAEAVKKADLVISAVTAEQSLAAATAALAGLIPESWFLDLNSVSPNTKRETAKLVEQAGGRYVEAAVMAPISPRGIATSILLGGPWAEAFLPLVYSLGFSSASYFDKQLGKAAACKMCRSVLIKGLESLLMESLLTARSYGVEDTVLDSLNNLMPGVDWSQHSAYMISRSLEHGTRRAEEMCEAALTVQEAGIEPLMSRACADTQLWSAQFSAALEQQSGEVSPLQPASLKSIPLQTMLDEILRLKTAEIKQP